MRMRMNMKTVTALLLLLFVSSCAKGPNTGSANNADLTPRATPVAVDEMAPDFTLEDQNGQKITLSAARGTAPTVLAFYRGNW
jgi:cytochrome oxidase Cu insertion factor (SCO1/SenC/PrrC family)